MRPSPDSAAAIKNIDDLLAAVGLRHGVRKAPGGGERQPGHPRQRTARQPAPTDAAPGAAKNQMQIVRPPLLSQIDWLISGFSTRPGGGSTAYGAARDSGEDAGELNLGFTPADPARTVLENRSRFLRQLTGDPAFPMATLHQIHSSLVRRIRLQEADSRWKADGMMTGEPGLLLAIQTADCIPVLVADRKKRAVAAFHAGWRGTLRRIVENGVGRMRLEFGSRPTDLVAAIGPGIGQCCYAVGEEVRSECLSQFAYAAELFCDVYDSDPIREKYPLLFLTARAPGHSNIGPNLHLDLVEANRRQLLDAGLHPQSISVVGDCTSCRVDRYFSYRAEQGFTGRMLSVIGIRPELR